MTSFIRPATPADAAALLAIYAPVVEGSAISFELAPPTEAEMADRVRRVTADAGPWVVLERGGTIAGYAYATSFRGRDGYATTRETTVYVHPEHRRSGTGRLLMEALLDDLAAGGAHMAVAVIALPNDASVALHESLGFTHAGTLHQVGRKLGAWWDEGFWELPLTGRLPGAGQVAAATAGAAPASGSPSAASPSASSTST